MTAVDRAPPLVDLEEVARARRARIERIGAWLLPAATICAAVGGWAWVVSANDIPHYILPGPDRVLAQLIEDWPILSSALLVTLRITLLALLTAVVVGVALAVVFAMSRLIEMSFFPFAVILQVTPVVSIAPLIFIYVESPLVALLICAWIVAFFPILSNTTLGLRSVDPGLDDLFTIYGASRWRRLRHLQLPTALPYFLGGLRIAGGLSLIGAIVAEYVAGTAGTGGGLAFRILEASYRLNIPRMFAALLLIGLAGVAIFAATTLLNHVLLRRWHDSALPRDR